MIRTGHNITLSVQIKIKKHGVTPARLYLICKSFRAATRLAFFWEYFVRLNEKCVFSFGSEGPRDAPEQLNWQVIQLHQQNRWCEIERNRQFCLTKYVFPHVSYSSCLFFVILFFISSCVSRSRWKHEWYPPNLIKFKRKHPPNKSFIGKALSRLMWRRYNM